jgi:hypothetical protein
MSKLTAKTANALFALWLADRDAPFTSEDFRRYIERSGFQGSDDPRWVGAVFRDASLRGKIQMDGLVKAKNPQAHQRPIRVWAKPGVKPRSFWRWLLW